jgi:hypothetical protein
MSLVNYSTGEITGKIATRKLVLRGAGGVVFVDTLDDALNIRGLPPLPVAAVAGDGVFDTVRSVSQLVLQNLSPRFGQEIGQP